jgi:predicted metal-dependent hydrolase
VQLRFAFDSRGDAAVLSPPTSPENDPGEQRIVFRRHRRARRYIMRVTPDGTVRVTLPPRGTLRQARAFVAAHREWIARQRRRVTVPRPGALRAYVERSYRTKAERELPEQLLALAAQHGISVTRVRVLNQRSRWGACSAGGVITLNWRLVLAPAFVREYVLLHELMHRRELNHSKRFWRLVAACCPRHVEARRWLREEGKLLWAD